MGKYLFVLIVALALGALAKEATELPKINIWSGREQTLSYEVISDWRVEADHGRVLAQGGNCESIRLHFPPLTGKESATLIVDDEKTARIFIHPEKLLLGIRAECQCRKDELENLGVKVVNSEENEENKEKKDCLFLENYPDLWDFEEKNVVLFLKMRDFPIKLEEGWQKISFGMDKKKGKLSVIVDEHEKVIDGRNGGISWVKVIAENGREIIVLPDDFELDEIENILFLKKELSK